MKLILIFALSEDALIHISSPIDKKLKIKCVSIQNIIADKLAACHRFGSGNTRMKDFDDLWRLSSSSIKIKSAKLTKLLKKRNTSALLDKTWIVDSMTTSWKSHQKKYKDLPEDLRDLFVEVNRWLSFMNNSSREKKNSKWV